MMFPFKDWIILEGYIYLIWSQGTLCIITEKICSIPWTNQNTNSGKKDLSRALKMQKKAGETYKGLTKVMESEAGPM
jgi:hypothetical protein